MRVAVVVLAGGQARRWGGRDKTAVVLGTRTVLERAVAGLRTGVRAVVPDAGGSGLVTVVAGPDEHAARAALAAVRWVREEPPGGGPVAGLAAAVAVLPPEVVTVVVGAGDAPFGGSAVPRLLGALRGPGAEAADGAVGVDPGGRRQPLLGAYRTAALRGALGRLGDPAAVSLRALLGSLRILEVAVTDREALDLDTPDALDEALRQAEAEPTDVSCPAGCS
ncbi:MAG: molybdenum cofactor guanylyltransferase [Kineosporiaceae bacterium]